MYDNLAAYSNDTNPVDNPREMGVGAAGSGQQIDFLSNGFKIRTSNAQVNTSDKKYAFWAWAESPFVTSSGVPTTGR